MNSSSEAVNAAILIGGKSSRMGSPKGLLEFDHLSLLEKIAAAADEVASSVVLIGDGPVPAALAGKKRLPDVPGHPRSIRAHGETPHAGRFLPPFG